MDFGLWDVAASIDTWGAAAVILVLSPTLAEAFAEWFDEEKKKQRGVR